MMTMSTDEAAAVVDYYRLMNLNGAARVYHTAAEAGVFDALSGGAATADEIAERCGAQVRPMRLMLEALAALGVVEADAEADRFTLTPLAQFLRYSGYRDLGDAYWAHLPTFLKTGRPIKRMDDRDQSESHYVAQAAALGWMLMPVAHAAAKRLGAAGIGHAANILDVGAGSAVWSLSLAAADPAARITALDWPAVLDVAEAAAAQAGVSERFATIAGDYHRVDLPPGAFDVAILANVTHLETASGVQSLLARVRRALRPGGHIVIIDGFAAQREGDLPRTLYSLGLALRTQRGQLHPADELQQWMSNSGFEDVRLEPLDVPPHMIGMMIGRKVN